MSEQQPRLEPIRTAAAAVLLDPPPLTEWEAGEDVGEFNGEVENLLKELGWPTRTRTFTVNLPVYKSNPRKTKPRESTCRYFPGSWIAALQDRVAEYVKVRDADQEPTVAARLQLRNLPQGADLDAFRDLVEGAWEDAWDELWCSVAVMWPYDAISLDGLRYNLSVYLWHGPAAFDSPDTVAAREARLDAECPQRSRETLSFEERLREVEADGFSDLRNLPSPKWRAWFKDAWDDRVAIHDTLSQCGVEATGDLDADLLAARYTFDADTAHMTIEELVNRLEARYHFFASAYRVARDHAAKDQSDVDHNPAGFSPRRSLNRPATWDTMMEMVAGLKRDNVRWKEIRERVEQAHSYRCDSEEALRKHFERWQKGRSTSE